MALTKNFAIPRGSAYRLNFVPTPAGSGPPPGSTVKFTASRRADSKTKIIETKDCSTPDSEGAYYCDLTADDTDVSKGDYFWDTRMVDAGSEALLGYGTLSITGIAQLPEAE